MSIDLVSIALAGAMPLLVFVLYLVGRSLRERSRAWLGGDGRSRRRERGTKIRSVVSTPATSVHAETPAATPMTPLPATSLPATPPPAIPLSPQGSAAASDRISATVPEPAPSQHHSGQPVLTKVPVVRPAAGLAAETPPTSRGDPSSTVPLPDPDGPARATLMTTPISTAAAPTATLRTEAAVVGSVRGTGSGAGPWLRLRLPGRLRNGDEAEPQWPAPAEPDGAMRLFRYFGEPPEPCPACAESRERGARFCRRCGQPVDLVAMTQAGTTSTRQTPLTVPQPAIQPTIAPLATVAEPQPPPQPEPLPEPTPAGVPVMDPSARRASRRARERPADDARVAATGGPTAPTIESGSADRREMRTTGERRPSPDGPLELLDLNRASVAELIRLKGVGRRTAERIVAARREAPFTSLDGLADRKVVGRAVVNRLRGQVVVAH